MNLPLEAANDRAPLQVLEQFGAFLSGAYGLHHSSLAPPFCWYHAKFPAAVPPSQPPVQSMMCCGERTTLLSEVCPFCMQILAANAAVAAKCEHDPQEL